MSGRLVAQFLVVIVVSPSGCARDEDQDIDRDEIGQEQFALNGGAPGYVTHLSTHSLANRCAVDPVADVSSGFTVNPNYVVAYRSGKDSSCSSLAPFDCDAPDPVRTGSGYATCTSDPWSNMIHRQGIQRLYRDSTNYLLVSMSVNAGFTGIYPGFEVVEMGAHGTENQDLGSAGVTPSTWPNCSDNVVTYKIYSSTVRTHGGGMQVNGQYVAVPFEDPNESVSASFRTFNLSNPLNPTSGPTRFRERGELHHGGAAAFTRTDDAKFLVMIFGRHQFHGAVEESFDVEVFASTGTSVPTDPTDWISKGAWNEPFGDDTELDYQNVQFITKCAGGEGTPGYLYALATHKNDSGEDWADLYSVTLNITTYKPTFTKVTNRKLTCSSANTGNTRYCDFDAGGGVYVDEDGRLILYGVEHYNDAYPDTGRGVKVREFPIP